MLNKRAVRKADCSWSQESNTEELKDMNTKFKVGDKVLCLDGCPGVIDSINTHEGQIRYGVSFGGGVDFGYYKENELIEYHKPEYITGDVVKIDDYESDVKIYAMHWNGYCFAYKVYLADEEEWITADDIAYKVTPVISDTIKSTLLSARDRGRIDNIIKARVIATGEIVDVHRLCASSQGDIWQEKSGREYFVHELDFDVKEPPKPRYNPDYWERLKHQYVGMAMQGMLNNSYLAGEFRKDPNNGIEDMSKIITKAAAVYAHALVEKMKEKEE